MQKIKEMPIMERPRERLIKNGASSLSNAELLAVVLRTGMKEENVVSLCRRLLSHYDLEKLSRININSLRKVKGIGNAKACQIVACCELARRIISSKQEKMPQILSAKDISKMLIPEFLGMKKEMVIGIYVDARNKILKKEIIFTGSLDSNIIHPREIFKIALLESAAGVILAHNHPSGNPQPSEEDIKVTKQLAFAGEVMGIELLDHVIIAGKKYISMREKGLI